MARSIESNTKKPVATCGSTGTVRNVASAMKPKVPSEPTIRWVSISIGRVKSTNAFTEYPIVFFIANRCSIRRTES